MLIVLAIGVAVALFAWGIVAYVRHDNAVTARENAHEDAVMQRVNTICGTGPKAIEHHNSGWSNGPFWTVTCPDGTVRVVPQ